MDIMERCLVAMLSLDLRLQVDQLHKLENQSPSIVPDVEQESSGTSPSFFTQ